MAASEALNLHIWARPDPQVVYLNGVLLFVAGLAIVRAQNAWIWRWPELLSLAGWIALAAGLYRMFMPEGPQAHESPATFAMLGLLIAVGGVLTSIGWRPTRTAHDGPADGPPTGSPRRS